jgi:hypothetical protein
MYVTFRASDLSAKPWMIENRTAPAGARRLDDRQRDVGQPVEPDWAGFRHSQCANCLDWNVSRPEPGKPALHSTGALFCRSLRAFAEGQQYPG